VILASVLPLEVSNDSSIAKARIQATSPGAILSEVARRYEIAARVLFRWKQELTQVAPLFVAVEIADATPPTNGG
jgi:transposase-like protein